MDADVEIPGVIAKGKLLTLTTQEALKHRLADARADTLDAVLASLDLAGAEVRRATPTWAESARALPDPPGGQLAPDDDRHPRDHRGDPDARLRRARRARRRQPRPLLLGPLAGAAGRVGGAAARRRRPHPPGDRGLRHAGLRGHRGPRARRPRRRPGTEPRRRRGDVGRGGHRRRAGRGVAPAGHRGVPGLVALPPAPPVRPPARPRDRADGARGLRVRAGDGPRLARQARDGGVAVAAGRDRRHRGRAGGCRLRRGVHRRGRADHGRPGGRQPDRRAATCAERTEP